MGVSLADDRLSKEESQIGWMKETDYFILVVLGGTLFFLVVIKLVNTQEIQSKSSKISELEKIVRILGV